MIAAPFETGLPAKIVAEVFPFILVLDRELRIVEWGRALHKVCKNLEVGAPLTTVLSLSRPRVKPTFSALLQAAHNAVFLDSVSTGIRLRGQLVHDAASERLLFLGSPWFTDINEIQKTQLELKDFTVLDPIVDFLYMVQAKTLALQDAQSFAETAAAQRDELQEVNRQLEAASSAKSQFLANTSHELRTPLNGIIGMTSLLQRTTLSAQQQRYAEIILASGRTLLHLVNDILDFTKIEAGKMTLEEIDFDLERILEAVGESAAVSAHNKGLEFLTILEPNVPRVLRGDPNRLRQVIDNLVTNAIKFTEKGEVAVRLICERLGISDAGEASVVLRIEVKDTGIGLSAGDQEKLFEVFSQVDSSMSRKYGGSGLGLALCKQLCKLMGGAIGVQSELGKGSTFWCRVALRSAVMTPLVGELTMALRPVRALVVDDNSTSRAYLQQMLSSWGAQSEVAEHGLRALEMLRLGVSEGKPYDLVIVDLLMPGMSGTDLLSIVTMDPALSSVLVVLLGSPGPSSRLPQSLSSRIHAQLDKPVRPSLLLNCLSRILRPFAFRNTPAPLPIPADPPAGASRGKVLIVDDNLVNVEVAVRIVEALGYQTATAFNGAEAVEACKRERFAAVLMDLQMPVMTGYEATAAIRELDGEVKDTPLIAMTAHAMPTDRERALAAGLDDYIAKPIDFEELQKLLRRWIDERSRRAPESAEGVSAPPPSAPEGEFGATGTDASSSLEIQPILDQRKLDELRRFQPANQPSLIPQLIQKFVNEASRRGESVAQAVLAKDISTIQHHAHALKSSSAILGARRLAAVCQRLEKAARGPAAEQVLLLAGEFAVELRLAIEVLRSITV